MKEARELVKLREGLKLKKYKDSLGKWTGGYGHLLLPGEENVVITQQVADDWFATDIKWAEEAALLQSKELPRVSKFLTDVLVSVNYQLGTGWTKKFPKTYALMKAGKYDQAALEVEDSLWAKQTPVRVRDFQRALWITHGLNL